MNASAIDRVRQVFPGIGWLYRNRFSRQIRSADWRRAFNFALFLAVKFGDRYLIRQMLVGKELTRPTDLRDQVEVFRVLAERGFSDSPERISVAVAFCFRVIEADLRDAADQAQHYLNLGWEMVNTLRERGGYKKGSVYLSLSLLMAETHLALWMKDWKKVDRCLEKNESILVAYFSNASPRRSWEILPHPLSLLALEYLARQTEEDHERMQSIASVARRLLISAVQTPSCDFFIEKLKTIKFVLLIDERALVQSGDAFRPILINAFVRIREKNARERMVGAIELWLKERRGIE